MIKPYLRPPYREGRKAWRPEKTLSITDFSGGMNNVEPQNEIADNESPFIKNMSFTNGKYLQKRRAFRQPVASININKEIKKFIPIFLDEYKPKIGSSNFICILGSEDNEKKPLEDTYLFCNNKKWNLGEIEQPSGVNYLGKYYFTDGKCLRVFDGENLYKIINNPIGYLSEDHLEGSGFEFKFKHIPESVKVGEKAVFLSSVTGATDGSGNAINITSKITGIDRENNTIRIEINIPYKVKKDSMILLYEPLNATFVIGEEVWDKDAGVAYYKPCIREIGDTHQGVGYLPDSPNLVTIHKNRLFIAGDKSQPHGVYISAVNQPLYFPVHAGMGVRPNGDEIVDFISFDNALVVGRKNDMYVIRGETEYSNVNGLTPFNISKLDTAVGLKNKNCGAILNDFYYFVGSDCKFYKMSIPIAYSERLSVKPLPNKINLLDKNVFIGDFDFSKILYTAVVHNGEIWWHVSPLDNRVSHPYVIIYNYKYMAYTVYDFGELSMKFITSKNRLLTFTSLNENIYGYDDETDSKYNAKMYICRDGWNDDKGDPLSYQCIYKTKGYNCGSNLYYKYFKSFRVLSEIFNPVENKYVSSYLTSVFVDGQFVRQGVVYSVASLFGEEIYDYPHTAIWGKSRFSTDGVFYTDFLNIDVRGKELQFEFTSNNSAPFVLFEVDVVFSARDLR